MIDDVEARLVVQGTTVAKSDVLLSNENAVAGSHAFVFNAKHVLADCLPTLGPIEIEWRSRNGQGSEIRARNMALYIKRQAVPDLAEPPPFGGVVTDARVEPMRGPHYLLVILWDPHRPSHPGPSTLELEDALFGPTNSVADYYESISDGRFTLESAGVLGPYDSDFEWDHYDSGPGDHQDKWVEALNDASADFDGDGYIHPWHELAIVIVVPQSSWDGFVRHLGLRTTFCVGPTAPLPTPYRLSRDCAEHDLRRRRTVASWKLQSQGTARAIG